MPSSNVALKILVVEDNEELLAATLAFLQGQGHYVRGVSMAEEIDDLAGGFLPDVYVIDLNLPDEDGLSLTRRLRASHSDVGIIITTARTQIGDKVLGYETGADHYLSKPVNPQELLACANALGKRLRMQSLQHHGALSFCPSGMFVTGPAGRVSLTSSDALILTALVRAAGQTLERWQIGEVIASNNAASLPSTATMEMRIARLRKKLVTAGGSPQCIKAVHKVGYTLCYPVTMSS